MKLPAPQENLGHAILELHSLTDSPKHFHNRHRFQCQWKIIISTTFQLLKKENPVRKAGMEGMAQVKNTGFDRGPDFV